MIWREETGIDRKTKPRLIRYDFPFVPILNYVKAQVQMYTCLITGTKIGNVEKNINILRNFVKYNFNDQFKQKLILRSLVK